MRRARSARRRRSLGAGTLGAIVLALTVALLVGGTRATPHASAQPASGEPTAQTDNSVPLPNVTMIGASPGEAPDEAWGIGQPEGGSPALVRYTSEDGWTLGPPLLDAAGQPLVGFKLDTVQGSAALSGRITASGSGVLAGEVPAEAGGEGARSTRQVILVRNPGGSFQEAPPLPSEGELALASGEKLFGSERAALIAAVDEPGAKAGAFVVPVKTSGVESSVLHFDGSSWTREQIDVPAASSGDFRVLGIGASSAGNAWLLAQLSASGPYPVGAVALFRRNQGSGSEVPSWRPVALSAGAGDGEAHPLEVQGATFTVHGTGEPPTVQSQVLTVTGEGVWVDGERRDAKVSTTLFFKPEGEDGGHILASWCPPPSGATPCEHELPESLPTGPSRSFAWANPATAEGLGERLITGLPEGVTLRLEGSSFARVTGLGGDPQVFPGGTFGAAFSNPREGWLGMPRLPVHVTMTPAANRLTPWPVSFSHALLAIAPQPEAPVGSLTSEALAVGDRGEVARYVPGKGWLPESLLGPGGRHEKPRLRAVAWPTPTRAYAVGDGEGDGPGGQMWLWRGETGLWEPDPATPNNFRGNLLGIAFEAGNPDRGYAVGQGGILLGYGKTWTQEEVPAAAAGADFTSIAFAGSEAIVTYRKLRNPDQLSSYEGGLLVNDGSGWRVDEGAAAAMGSQVPSVVAGLPDGGAAFAAESPGAGERTRIFERNGAGAPYQAVATPYPGVGSPGSLALFREGGQLRAIASGSLGGVAQVTPSPPGFPPPLVPAYGIGSNSERGVLRQTASGWSDEQHDLNSAREPPGDYLHYDTVYEPDPIASVLISPDGTQGWAVGGDVNGEHEELDTADVERYPADGVAPTGTAAAPIPLEAGQATFAIGGNAQCSAPCADREKAGIGPDVWLSNALERASQAGARAFLYTGPRVTAGETTVTTLAIPYRRELERYAALLGSSSLPAFAAAAPTDLDGQHSEATFASAFAGFPQPFGQASAPLGPGLAAAGSAPARCGESSGCESAYYALDSSGATGGETVRVIVLDDSEDVDAVQLGWLGEELRGAWREKIPAIVVGNADLNAQIGAGDAAAAAVAQTLIKEGASAYFYDSPERNVDVPLAGSAVPAIGSGTLGYISYTAQERSDFIGASGFLLAQVDTAARNEQTNRAPVTQRLIPNIGELSMEAEDGTLLRRSQAALFKGLARRPRAGNRSRNGVVEAETDPYIPIPSNCEGAICAEGIFPEYTFTSSRPDLGDFVEPNLASPESHAVLLGPDGKPVHDSHSGLFCAYNAGTTIVTITTGGLSYSLPVTIQAGSVRRPCGTVPLKELPAREAAAALPPAPAPAPAPAGAAPASALPPISLPPAPPTPAPLAPPAHPAAAVPAPFFVAPALPATPLAAVPPPVPTPARPTPPSGTSAVTSPVEAPEREEEEEEAPESVSNKAVAYRAADQEPLSAYLLGAMVLAAFAGAAARRRPRRGRREQQIAAATLANPRPARPAARSERRWR